MIAAIPLLPAAAAGVAGIAPLAADGVVAPHSRAATLRERQCETDRRTEEKGEEEEDIDEGAPPRLALARGEVGPPL